MLYWVWKISDSERSKEKGGKESEKESTKRCIWELASFKNKRKPWWLGHSIRLQKGPYGDTSWNRLSEGTKRMYLPAAFLSCLVQVSSSGHQYPCISGLCYTVLLVVTLGMPQLVTVKMTAACWVSMAYRLQKWPQSSTWPDVYTLHCDCAAPPSKW